MTEPRQTPEEAAARAAIDDIRSASALSANEITVRFGGMEAVSAVSLALKPAEILGLIGPNGAGKTTLVNVLTGFQRPTAGEIRLNGVSTLRWSPNTFRRRGIARTFQSVRLFTGMTVLENVEVTSVALGHTRAKAQSEAREALAWLGLSGVADRQVRALPYVTERRVGIARALVGAPQYLLLDEPAAGMSEEECRELLEVIQTIPEKVGCGVLLIEHNMHLVMSACERVHVLDGGKTLAEGLPADIQSNENVVSAYLGEVD